MRKHPLMWEDEGPQDGPLGVLSPYGGDDTASPSLLGLPNGDSLLRSRDVRADAEAGPAVHAALAKIADALHAAATEGRAARRRLDGLSPDERAMLYDALGEGEVSVVIAPGVPGEGEAQIAETVLPGVWIGRAYNADGQLQTEWVEVADAPRALREVAATRPRADIALEAITPPRGAMNVMGVLAEIRDRAAAWRPGTANHVINFTLFPMNETDTAFLAQVLGEAGARATSGGYGAARVIMTGLQHVWAVQYLNGMGAVILDTIEVGDIPEAMLAGPQDFEDSAERLSEILDAYRPADAGERP